MRACSRESSPTWARSSEGRRSPGDLHARIATGYDVSTIDIGASIACDGVCLTVVALGQEPRPWFDVTISAETVSKTNVGDWRPGTRVNLERALRLGDELGGHIVSGHVDGLAEVLSVRDEGESTRIRFRAPGGARPLHRAQGVGRAQRHVADRERGRGAEFGVNLIPHTKAVTTWGATWPRATA
jgi:riboflavin synthase